MTWDPSCYGTHSDLRLRPGLELIARIPNEPFLVYDLGCGTGELTNLLSRRWPNAAVIGIDNSPEMLDRARPQGNVTFVQKSIEDWIPESPPDLIFSNAALHWVGDHKSLFPRLLSVLGSEGVLAVQMPDNWEAPTHLLIHEEIARRGWSERLQAHLLAHPVARVEEYIAWLGGARGIDAWRTTYYQSLRGEDPVLSWVRGSVLVPVRSALTQEEFVSLEAALAGQYRSAYPRLPDGTTVMAMSRLFLVVAR